MISGQDHGSSKGNALEGRVAIVTGAASGIGRATARLLAAEGAAVVVADKNVAGARAVAQALQNNAIAIGFDLTQPGSIQECVSAVIKQFGRLDILINNASDIREMLERDLDVVSTDLEIWDRSFLVNLRGPAAVCKFAIPEMIKSGGGAIVNLASVQGITGDVTRTVYSALKAGIISLTRSTAVCYGRQNIRCNSVSPGLAVDPSFESPVLDIMRSNMLIPIRGVPEDLASVIAFLVTDASKYITGQNIVVDGGMLSHMPYNAQMEAAGLAP